MRREDIGIRDPYVGTVRREDIHIRDPFVLAEGGKYYLYGSTDPHIWGGDCRSFDMYESEDLEEFLPPVRVFERPEDFWADENYWAPEVHRYRGRYFLIASFFKKGKRRASQILSADSPYGPFLPHSGPVTPADWECLDGTLWFDDGTPCLIFSHEWTQIRDGTLCVQRLSEDLKTAVGEPRVLFSASSAPWVRGERAGAYFTYYITDGPFPYRLADGRLLLLWSSCGQKGYAVGMAISDSGSVFGHFRHLDRLLFEENGGHGMLFRDFGGKLLLALHQPNTVGAERPRFIPCREEGEGLIVEIREEV